MLRTHLKTALCKNIIFRVNLSQRQYPANPSLNIYSQTVAHFPQVKLMTKNPFKIVKLYAVTFNLFEYVSD